MSENSTQQNPNGKYQFSFREFVGFVKDISLPQPEIIDIRTSSDQEILEAVALIKKAGVTTAESSLRESLKARQKAVMWVLQRYNYPYPPIFGIVYAHRYHSMSRLNIGYSPFRDRVLVGLERYQKLKDKPLNKPYPIIYDSSLPIPKVYLTLIQEEERVTVEETLHYLQEKGLPGLVTLPASKEEIPSESVSLLEYYRQPHEKQALSLTGEYFTENYGENLLQPILDFVSDN